MSTTNPKVDGFLRCARKWQEELTKLRTIILDCEMTEELKWGKPCYSFEKHNIVLIQPFKDYFALLFFKGVLLKDAKGILVRPGENSQAARQIRFTNVQEIVNREATLKAYIREAIELEKTGAKVKLTRELNIPEELRQKLDEVPALKTAFEALTPGRQRAYVLHFSAPKQSTTRASRVEKCMPQILNGKGLNDE